MKFSNAVTKLIEELIVHTQQVKNSSLSPLVSVLLWGPSGSGKTALAAHIAQLSGFPFIKLISPNDFLGFHVSPSVSSCDG